MSNAGLSDAYANPHVGAGDDAGLPEDGWPVRAWGITALGAIAALSVYAITETKWAGNLFSSDDLKYGFAAFIGISTFLFALLVERTKVAWALGFALLGGLCMGLTIYGSGPYDSHWDDVPQPLRIVCATAAVAIATVLFQAWRDHRNGLHSHPNTSTYAPDAVTIKSISYPRVYTHAWNDVILWLGSWVVVAIVFAITILLSQLFKLIGLDFLEDLLEHAWFRFALSGAAFGAGISLLRDRGTIITSIQRVITTVLSVLAPMLAFGLALFLLALPFTGLESLWAATRATSPILFACIIGALILASAVLAEGPRQEARHPVLRGSLLVLALCILPLAIIAAISTGMRVSQYGLTPDRLWAMTFTSIALVCGLAYLATIVRYRQEAPQHLRKVNLLMGFGIAILAFLLATPLLHFGAISAKNQIARLNDGSTSLKEFDWVSMRFSYGEAGREELRKLMRASSNSEVRKLASEALAQKDRWAYRRDIEANKRIVNTDTWTILPKGSTLPPALLTKLKKDQICFGQLACVIEHKQGSAEALVVSLYSVTLYQLPEGGEWDVKQAPTNTKTLTTEERVRAMEAGYVETRNVTRRQVYVNGVPVGDAFE